MGKVGVHLSERTSPVNKPINYIFLMCKKSHSVIILSFFSFRFCCKEMVTLDDAIKKQQRKEGIARRLAIYQRLARLREVRQKMRLDMRSAHCCLRVKARDLKIQWSLNH